MVNLIGTSGAETIIGTADDDRIDGLEGNDTLRGIFGSDTISGGWGNDRIESGAYGLVDEGRDVLIGGGGSDRIIHHSGPALIIGGGDGDSIESRGTGVIYGGGGGDWISFHEGRVFAGAGGDRVTLNLTSAEPGIIMADLGPIDDEYDRFTVYDYRTAPVAFDLRDGANPAGDAIRVTGTDKLEYYGSSQSVNIIDGSRSCAIELSFDDHYAREVIGLPTKARVWLGAGDDYAVVFDYDEVTVLAGAGDDDISIVYLHQGFVDGGQGVDEVTIDARPDYSLNPLMPAASPQLFTVDARAGAVAGDEHTVVLANVESVILGDGVASAYQTWEMLRFFGNDTGMHVLMGSAEISAVLGSGADTVELGHYITNSEIYLGAGDDTLTRVSDLLTNVVDATVRCGNGNDVVDLHHFHGQISGGAGHDLMTITAIMPDSLPISLYGDAGNDTLLASGSGKFFLDGGIGADSLAGSDSADVLFGGEGDDILSGGLGNDVLQGGAGADSLTGGDGVDRARYADATRGVVVDLADGSANRGDALGDTLTGIEDLLGSAHGDFLSGNYLANQLRGGAGNDRLSGRGGADQMTGGEGADSFIYRASYGRDLVTDFQNDRDQLDLRGMGFTSFAEISALGTEQDLDGDNRLDTVFDFGNGNSLTVMDVSIGALANDVLL